MAICKNGRIGQPDTDTGRTGCTGERHHTGYNNLSGKGFQAEAETCPGRRNRKRYPEDRSSAKRSKHNLALIRKFAYNILRIAILSGDCAEIMTEAMDDFSDDSSLRKKYVFSGIASFY